MSAVEYFPDVGELLTIQSSTDRITGFVDQNTRIIVELDETSIRSLDFLARSNDNCMSNIASTDFVGDTAVCGVFGTEVSLFLDDDDDAVT
jgi:hypothetical protein